MIKHIEIKNFRGIHNLKVDDPRKFNIIIGKNGTGKTSVLEAISLAASGRKKEHFFNLIVDRRHYVGNENEVLDCIFPNTEPVTSESSDKPTVSINFQSGNSQRKSGTYELSFYISGESESFQFDTGKAVDSVYEVAYSHPTSNSQDHNTHTFKVITGGAKINFDDPSPCQTCLSSTYIPFGITATKDTLRDFAKIVETKSQLKELVKRLSKISHKLENLLSIGTSVKAHLKNVDKALPISALGSGFCRLFEVFVKTSQKPDIIAIDEIDSGLHHGIMEKTWDMLITALQKDSTQLFCTTHSEELLEKTLSAFRKCPEDLAIYRLVKTPDEKLLIQRIDFETLKEIKSSDSSLHIS